MSLPLSAHLPTLLRGEANSLRALMGQGSCVRWLLNGGILVSGAGLFGAAIGWWRGPEQAFYTAVKFPLIILLTTLGNGLLNAMLAPLLGVSFSFRQVQEAIFMSFTIAAAILGAGSPLVAFLIWNMPPLGASGSDRLAHSYLFVALVAVMMFAGVLGNLRLFQWLRESSACGRRAARTLCAWLLGNLLLGSQITWILRPFVGSPDLPVQFLREEPLRGSFFEALFQHAQNLFS